MWPYIKAISAHLADWGFQTTAQAVHKAHCPAHRFRHCLIVSGSHGMAALTSGQTSWRKRLLYVLVNGISHYLIDSTRLPKWADQALHIAVALVSAGLLKKTVSA
jgi:hypothetical protein